MDSAISTETTYGAAKTEGKDLLEDFSDGLEALMAVPVWFLSTWVMRNKAERVLGQNQESSLSDEAPRADQAYHCQLALCSLI